MAIQNLEERIKAAKARQGGDQAGAVTTSVETQPEDAALLYNSGTPGDKRFEGQYRTTPFHAPTGKFPDHLIMPETPPGTRTVRLGDLTISFTDGGYNVTVQKPEGQMISRKDHVLPMIVLKLAELADARKAK